MNITCRSLGIPCWNFPLRSKTSAVRSVPLIPLLMRWKAQEWYPTTISVNWCRSIICETPVPMTVLPYWVSSGFEADGENGASGTASFKAVGVEGMTLSLAQTVYPSNRSSYTLSAQIASDDLKKLSDDAQVGIEVVIEYEDGSIETRFIDLY